ncbi:MAG: hypothetical protein Q4D19_09590, partial [Lautropia sp.]|nr:hypothetical protein [Lautropia sp.]
MHTIAEKHLLSPAFPEFFTQAPTLLIRDPLADFLGASRNGLLEYHYLDVVKLTGHSCPTVAGAWLMVIRGLETLYHDGEIPERGNILAALKGERDSGTVGVVGSVVTLLTGATVETGFPGLGPGQRFSRRNLLDYDADLDAPLQLTRRDTGHSVRVTLDTSVVPANPDMKQLMGKAILGQASPDEMQRFGRHWQDRVRIMLTELA